MNKHIGLDLHGIINSYPDFFAAITQSLVKDGWMVTVLTGSHIKEQKIEEELKRYGIAYTHLFSIADYHKENKTEGMWYDYKGDPWISDEEWNRTKAVYCKKHGIAFCIDDTARYASDFETPFGYMSIQLHKDKPNKYLSFIIEMFRKRSQKSVWQRFESWFNKNIGYFLNNPNKLGKEEQNKKYQ